MKISYAFHAGTTNTLNGKPCQDYIQKYQSQDISVLVLSDGAGSKPEGLVSARLLVQTTIDYFIKHSNLDSFNKDQFIAHVNKAFKQKGLDSTTAGGTLLFCATDGDQFLVGHMGDGVALIRENQVFSVLSLPENGEYINQTFFFPSNNAQDHFRIIKGKAAPHMCIIIASDGVANSLYDLVTLEVANACEKLAIWIDEVDEEQFENILRESFEHTFSKRTEDDMSIGILAI